MINKNSERSNGRKRCFMSEEPSAEDQSSQDEKSNNISSSLDGHFVAANRTVSVAVPNGDQGLVERTVTPLVLPLTACRSAGLPSRRFMPSLDAGATTVCFSCLPSLFCRDRGRKAFQRCWDFPGEAAARTVLIKILVQKNQSIEKARVSKPYLEPGEKQPTPYLRDSVRDGAADGKNLKEA